MIVNSNGKTWVTGAYSLEVKGTGAKKTFKKADKIFFDKVDRTKAEKVVETIIKWATPAAYTSALTIYHPINTFAAGATVSQTVTMAFQPLIELIRTLSYPIAGVMIAGGCLFIMIGSREKGMDMLKSAALGYVLVQLSPLFLKLLVQVGTQVMG